MRGHGLPPSCCAHPGVAGQALPSLWEGVSHRSHHPAAFSGAGSRSCLTAAQNVREKFRTKEEEDWSIQFNPRGGTRKPTWCCPNSLAQRATGSAAAATKPKYSPSFRLCKGPELASEDCPRPRGAASDGPGAQQTPAAAGAQAALALAGASAPPAPLSPTGAHGTAARSRQVPSCMRSRVQHRPARAPAGRSALRPSGWYPACRRWSLEKGFSGVWGPGEQVFISRAALGSLQPLEEDPPLVTTGQRVGQQASEWELGAELLAPLPAWSGVCVLMLTRETTPARVGTADLHLSRKFRNLWPGWRSGSNRKNERPNKEPALPGVLKERWIM